MATYYGGTGNDAQSGSSGNDVAYGYGGNDTFSGLGGADTAYGGDGADSIAGGTGDDWGYGDGGNDTLQGDAGYDRLFGGTGDDRLVGANDIYDDFYGGDGNDTILAGDFDEDWAWGERGNDLIQMGGGSDLAWGGQGADTLAGGTGNDVLQGGQANDSVQGEAGADRVLGGAGNDTVLGGDENDVVMGGAGRDVLYGGTGDDLLRGDSDAWDGFDASTGPVDTTITITNGASFTVDVYWINEFAQPVYYTTLAPGQSWTTTTGSTHNWFLTQTGSSQPVEVIYGAVNQTVTFSPPFDDSIYGGDGNDTVFGDFGNDSIWGEAGNDSLSTGIGNDLVYGGTGNDTATLGAGNDTFGDWSNELGDDSLDAGAGDDSVIAGGGNDTVLGGDGNDWLSGAGGSDQLFGGAGSDRFAITDDHEGDTISGGESAGDMDVLAFANWASSQGVVVAFSGSETGSYDFVGTSGAGSFSQIEGVTGTDWADTIDGSAAGGGLYLSGNAGDDLILGGAGHDTLHFGSGNDTVFGGAGDDVIDDVDGWIEAGDTRIDAGAGRDLVWAGGGADTVLGGDDDDTLIGEDGNDLLEGGAGADALYGDGGDDTLAGGLGQDSLKGGEGRDLFQLLAAESGDQIADFDLRLESGSTIDRLDVSDLQDGKGGPVKVWHVRIAEDDAGNTVLSFPEGESVTLQGVLAKEVSEPGMLAAMGVPCFAAGTRIATPDGPRPVERLHPGDRVRLAGGGTAPVLWCGARWLSATQLQNAPALRPIRLAAAGWGLARDLVLSPQHCVALPGPAGPVLVRARHLAAYDPFARVVKGARGVSYHHILLPCHDLVLAEGLAVESLYPGPLALASLPPADFVRLLACLRDLGGYGARCLPVAARAQAARAVARRLTGNHPAPHQPALSAAR